MPLGRSIASVRRKCWAADCSNSFLPPTGKDGRFTGDDCFCSPECSVKPSAAPAPRERTDAAVRAQLFRRTQQYSRGGVHAVLSLETAAGTVLTRSTDSLAPADSLMKPLLRVWGQVAKSGFAKQLAGLNAQGMMGVLAALTHPGSLAAATAAAKPKDAPGLLVAVAHSVHDADVLDYVVLAPEKMVELGLVDGKHVRLVGVDSRQVVCVVYSSYPSQDDWPLPGKNEIVTYGYLRECLGINISDTMTASAFDMPIAKTLNLELVDNVVLGIDDYQYVADRYIRPWLEGDVLLRLRDVHILRDEHDEDDPVTVGIQGYEPPGLAALGDRSTRVFLHGEELRFTASADDDDSVHEVIDGDEEQTAAGAMDEDADDAHPFADQLKPLRKKLEGIQKKWRGHIQLWEVVVDGEKSRLAKERSARDAAKQLKAIKRHQDAIAQADCAVKVTSLKLDSLRDASSKVAALQGRIEMAYRSSISVSDFKQLRDDVNGAPEPPKDFEMSRGDSRSHERRLAALILLFPTIGAARQPAAAPLPPLSGSKRPGEPLTGGGTKGAIPMPVGGEPVPLLGGVARGLPNLGETCFIQASLVALAALATVRGLPSHGYPTIQTILPALVDSSLEALPPAVTSAWRSFVQLQGKAGTVLAAFKPDQPDDARAFIMHLANAWPALRAALLVDMTTTTLREGGKCKSCGRDVFASERRSQDVNLPLPAAPTLKQALDAYFTTTPGLMEHDRPACVFPVPGSVSHRLTADRLPRVLVVNFLLLQGGVKLPADVEVPDTVEVSPYTLNAEALGITRQYTLRSVVVHVGKTLRRGHYVAAYNLGDPDAWFLADDLTVTPVSRTTAMTPLVFDRSRIMENRGHVYLAFYEYAG